MGCNTTRIEVTHSPQGMETLRHFLFDVCKVTSGGWRTCWMKKLKLPKAPPISGGDVTRENALEIVQQNDEIFIQSIKEAGLCDKIWRALAGVSGSRSISWSSRGSKNTFSDGMTAKPYKLV